MLKPSLGLFSCGHVVEIGPQQNVIPDSALVQCRLLAHERKLVPVVFEIQSRGILAIDMDGTGHGVVEPLDQGDDRALAASACTDECNVLSRLRSQRKAS